LRPPHALRVTEPPERFAALLQALAAAGLRAGWLDLAAPTPFPDGLATLAALATLDQAAALGALRAVAVAGGRSLALKALRGAPVWRDLLREHFQGCALVLVAGAAAAGAPVPPPGLAALISAGEGWRVEPAGDAASRQYDTAGLLAQLRRPHPWDPPAAG
jgi:hypothetical protein